jgi:cytochrome P450
MSTHITAKRPQAVTYVDEPPIVGSVRAHTKDRLSLYLRVLHECGDVGGFHFGPFPIIMFNTAEFVKSICVEYAYDFDKGPNMHAAFRPVSGNGIFISEGAFHRQQRKLMAPSFQPRHIIGYANTMVGYGERVQRGWSEGEVIDLSQEMSHLAMSIIGKVLFDADVFTETDELGAAMTSVLAHICHRITTLLPIPLSWPTPLNRRTQQALKVLRDRIQRMIDERRSTTKERDDFLSLLLRARDEYGSRMNDEQISDESVTLFSTGYETIAAVLTWTWYLLAGHHDVYQKVQQEVDNVLKGRPPVYTDLAQLPYCSQVFKETMRLYPPAYAISRVALRDIKIGDYLIHKRQTVVVAPYVLHRNQDYFPDPEQFNPERFTPENEERLPRYSYLPFGAGPRICIGNYFAMMEMHLLLATLAQRVTFELIPGQEIVSDPSKTFTLRPRYGVKVIVRRRDRGK